MKQATKPASAARLLAQVGSGGRFGRMKFTLEIEIGNEAVETLYNVAEALEQTAHRMLISFPPAARGAQLGVKLSHETGIIYDMQGNQVGEWRFE